MMWGRIIIVVLAIIPNWAYGQVIISEIMYDPKDTDANSGGEWIEVQNTGSVAVDLTQWIFFEADTNHGIVAESGVEVPPGGYAVISRDLTVFRNYFSNFSGQLFKSSFSLNDGETLAVKNGKEAPVSDSVAYSSEWGGKNDGNSLQKVGGEWKNGVPTPGAANVESAPAASAAQSNSSADAALTEEPAAGLPLLSTEPKIFAKIYSMVSGVVGQDILFEGRAWGLANEPLNNARFLWNFGDGAMKEGRSIVHLFAFPGDYVVVLEVSSDVYEAVARQTVRIVAPQLTIAEVKSGESGFITIENKSGVELDLSYWRLNSSGRIFELPKNSLIMNGKKMILPNSLTGLSADGEVLLLYPSGFTAATYTDLPKVVSSPPAPIATGAGQVGSIKSSEEPSVSKPPPASLAAVQYADGGVQDSRPEIEGIQENTAKGEKSGTKWLLFLSGLIVVSSGAYLFGGRRTGVNIQNEGKSINGKESFVSADGYKVVDVSAEED